MTTLEMTTKSGSYEDVRESEEFSGEFDVGGSTQDESSAESSGLHDVETLHLDSSSGENDAINKAKGLITIYLSQLTWSWRVGTKPSVFSVIFRRFR